MGNSRSHREYFFKKYLMFLDFPIFDLARITQFSQVSWAPLRLWQATAPLRLPRSLAKRESKAAAGAQRHAALAAAEPPPAARVRRQSQVWGRTARKPARALLSVMRRLCLWCQCPPSASTAAACREQSPPADAAPVAPPRTKAAPLSPSLARECWRSFDTRWQDLKDHARAAGEVRRP